MKLDRRSQLALFLLIVCVAMGSSLAQTPQTPTPPCAQITVGSTFPFPASGGPGSVDVFPNPSSCFWTPSTPDSWIHPEQGLHFGDNPIKFTVDANASTSSRTGSITISGGDPSDPNHPTATFNINQDGVPPPDFSLSATPGSQSVNMGGSTSFTVTVGSQNGFNGNVGLSVSGLPTGVSGGFNPGSVNGSGNSTLSISTTSSTSPGTYTLSINGASGSLSHTIPVTLVVNGNFSISATPSSQTAGPGQSTNYAVAIGSLNGFIGNVNLSVTGLPAGATSSFNPVTVIGGSGNSTLNVSLAGSTPLGTRKLTIKGTMGTLSHSVNVTLVVSNDFSLSATPDLQAINAGHSTSFVATVAPVNGFSGNVNLSVSGLPAGASGGFNPATVSGGSGTSALSISTTTTTSPGSYPLTITGTSGNLTHMASVTLVIRAVHHLTGDFDGDRRTDIALTSGQGWTSLPVAFSNGGGNFNITNGPVADFGTWASTPGVTALVGDFNGDGKADIALVGGPGWTSIPVAFSNGDGNFNVTDGPVADFGTWASTPGVTALVGDFNGDGKADIALVGGPGWYSIPIAFSNGDGNFTVTNGIVPNFGTWASTPGVTALVGDFNGDGKADIALTGAQGWASIPVAFSNGDGNFNITNGLVPNFGTWASLPGVTPLVGDFNGDGKADIALTGAQGWVSIPIAFSNGDGNFNITNGIVPNFETWASLPGVTPLVGDFNGDGKADIALTGAQGWSSIPVAFSNGDGNFNITNGIVPNFETWASLPGVTPLVGDFNGDGKADIALTGAQGWISIPVAFSNGDGNFNITNGTVGDFGTWSSE